MYIVTKTYGHERGLSCAFRQWRANHSHCQFLHGYALSFEIKFSSESLDGRNWVIDFGGLKWIEETLRKLFDHKVAVAQDDPRKDEILALSNIGVMEPVVFDAVGCEAFAKFVYDTIVTGLAKAGMSDIHVESVECREHGANAAMYRG